MRRLIFNDVNDAFERLTHKFQTGEFELSQQSSRVGDTVSVVHPVLIEYRFPRRRVLFNEGRDANPFFHLFESLWMLAGRNDVASLAYYNSRMVEFSDDGKTFNGAYGYRWRNAACWGFVGDSNVDQLNIIIEHLKSTPNSRRAVLQMWNVEDDLLKVGRKCTWCGGDEHCNEGTVVHERDSYNDRPCDECNGTGYIASKDVCCNTCVYFSLREVEVSNTSGLPRCYALDMTVCNRSNDMIWGMLGANYVHYSMLQEYVANCLGAVVGTYWQFTNNLHVYKKTWEIEKWFPSPNRLCAECRQSHNMKEYVSYGQCDGCGKASWSLVAMYPTSMYFYADSVCSQSINGGVLPCSIPLCKDKEVFDEEVIRFVDEHGQGVYSEPFLMAVAKPMVTAYRLYKEKKYSTALITLARVVAEDWRAAGRIWLERRIARKNTPTELNKE